MNMNQEKYLKMVARVSIRFHERLDECLNLLLWTQ